MVKDNSEDLRELLDDLKSVIYIYNIHVMLAMLEFFFLQIFRHFPYFMIVYNTIHSLHLGIDM